MTERDILALKRANLELRSRVLQGVRSFFQEEGFLEVQTPVLIPAPAPEPHIEAIPAKNGMFLVTSPELYMKRLLAAGYTKVYQISPVFREGEYGRLHHPEFTMLEWYRLHTDYEALKEDCRRLLRRVCRETDRGGGWDYQGRRLEVEGDWDHISVEEAFLRYAGWKPDANVDQDRFDLDMVEKVESRLGFPRPCILSDYPVSQAALARVKPGRPDVAERFELYWAGVELANGFSELTDPVEQRKRFEEALGMRRRMGCLEYPMPETFLRSLEHLPPCAGIAMGMDRLVMLLADSNSLDDVVAFPPALQRV